MAYRFKDRGITSVADLMSLVEVDEQALLAELTPEEDKRFLGIWYRGVPSARLKLLPTLYRRKIAVGDEVHLMNRFKQNAHEFLDERPQGEWEWILLARHHGLPSRLLDWTESALAGLFFASRQDERYQQSDGALWCLSPGHLNEFAKLPTDVLPMFPDQNELSDENLYNYRTSMVADPVRGESRSPVAAIGIRATKRIQAQLGVFTVHHADTTPLEAWSDGSHVWRYTVPKGVKASIQQELRRLGVTALSLFPDLDNVAREAERGY